MILILGGTKIARLLADHLGQKNKIIYSIAGITKQSKKPKNCQQMVGGFGGAAGLQAYITDNQIDLCIDATHPFATNISQNAIHACQQANIPIIQYARKAWQIDAAKEFKTANNLIAALPNNARILLTIGSQNIEPFLKLGQPTIARMIEPPKICSATIGNNFKIILSRPPYQLQDEINLLKTNNITHLVAKNSGGNHLAAKIIAAQKLNLNIFMLAQPTSPHKIQFFNTADIEDYLYNLSLSSPS